MIDLDERGIELSTAPAERNIGKAYAGERIQQEVLYSQTDKQNLLLAICGDQWTGEGTTRQQIINFVQMILVQIPPGSAARRYCFIMNNLR